jgi:hypothetical protein
MSQKPQSEFFIIFFKKTKVNDDNNTPSTSINVENKNISITSIISDLSKVISTNEFDIGLAVDEKSNLLIRKDLKVGSHGPWRGVARELRHYTRHYTSAPLHDPMARGSARFQARQISVPV